MITFEFHDAYTIPFHFFNSVLFLDSILVMIGFGCFSLVVFSFDTHLRMFCNDFVLNGLSGECFMFQLMFEKHD